MGTLFFKHAWILFIAVTLANGLILKYRFRKYITENPALKEGYDKYVKGFIFYGNIPWILMAFGNLTGLTHHVFEYFDPKAMNPVVLIFHASIVVLWILSVRWVYFNKGAEFIEAHPGLFQNSFSGSSTITAKQVKLFLPLMILGGIAGMIMMWLIDTPIPHFLK